MNSLRYRGSGTMIALFLHRHYRWLLPLVLLALFTPWSATLDVASARLFYTPSSALIGRFSDHPFYTFLFDFGPWPGLMLAWGSLVFVVLSYSLSRWHRLRAPCLTFMLTLLVGGGLITHVLLKDHWGRPRPRQVDLFGGQQPFRPYYQPNFWQQPEPSKSFPCGHCTAGFVFFTLGLLGRELKRPWLHYGGYAFALVLGGLLGWTRMVQGGHFLSDIFVAALIMWETALCMHWLCYRRTAPCTG